MRAQTAESTIRDQKSHTCASGVPHGEGKTGPSLKKLKLLEGKLNQATEFMKKIGHFWKFFFVLFLIANKKKRHSDPPGLLHSNVSTCFVFWEFLTDAYFLPPYPGVGSFSFLANAVVTASSELNLCIYLYGPNPVARFSTPRLGVRVYFNHTT